MKSVGFYRKVFLLCFALTTLFYACLFAQRGTGTGKHYLIRFNSGTEKTAIEKGKKLWEAKGCPVYTGDSVEKGIKKYWLEMGGFSSKSDASLFAAYFHIDPYDITEVPDTDADKYGRLKPLIIKTQPEIGTGIMYYYFGKLNPFLILYQLNSGFEGALAPSDLFLFSGNLQKELHLDEITGFAEKEHSLLIGKSVEVFFNPGHFDIKDKMEDVKKTANANKIPVEEVKKHIIHFDDGFSARVTLLAVCDLESFTLSFPGKIGFDFFSEAKGEIRYTGNISYDSDIAFGNSDMQFIDLETINAITHFAAGNITLFAQKDETTRLGKFIILFKE